MDRTRDGKRYLSADDYLRDSWRLAAQVRAAGWKPDLILALWRGGTPVGVAVQEFFRLTGWGDVRHLPLACASYTGIGANEGEVVFSCAEEALALLAPGTKVLVIDDVFDTGKTAAALAEKVSARGAEARFACVYFKPAKNRTTLRPYWFVHEADTSWIVFPHEIEGLSPSEIAYKDPLLASLISGVRRTGEAHAHLSAGSRHFHATFTKGTRSCLSRDLRRVMHFTALDHLTRGVESCYHCTKQLIKSEFFICLLYGVVQLQDMSGTIRVALSSQ